MWLKSTVSSIKEEPVLKLLIIFVSGKRKHFLFFSLSRGELNSPKIDNASAQKYWSQRCTKSRASGTKIELEEDGVLHSVRVLIKRSFRIGSFILAIQESPAHELGKCRRVFFCSFWSVSMELFLGKLRSCAGIKMGCPWERGQFIAKKGCLEPRQALARQLGPVKEWCKIWPCIERGFYGNYFFFSFFFYIVNNLVQFRLFGYSLNRANKVLFTETLPFKIKRARNKFFFSFFHDLELAGCLFYAW